MDKKLVLKIILGISIGGIVFSGYLTIIEMASDPVICTTCNQGIKILGLPVCVYGLMMYAAIFALSLIGLLE